MEGEMDKPMYGPFTMKYEFGAGQVPTVEEGEPRVRAEGFRCAC